MELLGVKGVWMGMLKLRASLASEAEDDLEAGGSIEEGSDGYD